MKEELRIPEIYVDFLKLCCEHDESENLTKFRHGLFLVIKAIGISHVAEETGISRITIDRMLSKEGNPELNSLVKLMRFLKMHLWIVDQHFIKTNRKLVRMRGERPDPDDVYVSTGRRIGPKRNSDKS
jgi:DNA-binding phage protein